MKFIARSSTLNDFNAWVQKTQKSPSQLTFASYSNLAKPTKNVAPMYYTFPMSSSSLYNTVIMKYMAPSAQN
jgi:hypothetical protein